MAGPLGQDSPIRVGILGAGNISSIYIENLQADPMFELVGIADMVPERTEARANKYGIEGMTPDAMMQRDDLQAVVNLTPPLAHFSTTKALLQAGKSVYCEKPLAFTLAEVQELVALANEKGLHLGGAPDTVLGAGVNTVMDLIEAGHIGIPVGYAAHMLCGGHESWHPDPDFYYQPGGGPLFDMGPYYLTALVHWFGPVAQVSASARTVRDHRTIGSGPRAGTVFPVEVMTHIVCTLTHHSGVIGTLTTSFETPSHELPHIEIHGTGGGIRAADPNGFGGPVVARQPGEEGREMPLGAGPENNMRGLGLQALVQDDSSPVGADRVAHVVEIMAAALESAQNRSVMQLTTRPNCGWVSSS